MKICNGVYAAENADISLMGIAAHESGPTVADLEALAQSEDTSGKAGGFKM